jgi:hypothetical protein
LLSKSGFVEEAGDEELFPLLALSWTNSPAAPFVLAAPDQHAKTNNPAHNNKAAHFAIRLIPFALTSKF